MAKDQEWTALAAHRDELRASTDRLQAGIERVETRLRGLGLAVGASVVISAGTDQDGCPWQAAVGFRKLDGGWRLTFEERGPAIDGDIQYEPLASASRRMRVLASTHLDALLSALGEAARGQGEEVARAAQRFDAFAESVPQLDQPGSTKSHRPRSTSQ